MKRVRQWVGAWFSLARLYCAPVHAQSWDSLRSTIRRRFPDLRQLSTADLAAWLAETNRPQPILIDARSQDEFSVSHLPGAHHAETADAVRQVAVDPRRAIVVYCSVGYRSAALAERLRRAGYRDVFNLDGSIFAWAHEGRPVFRGGKPLSPTRVHPYDTKWSRLLNPELHGWK